MEVDWQGDTLWVDDNDGDKNNFWIKHDLGGRPVRRHQSCPDIHRDKQACHSRSSGMFRFPAKINIALMNIVFNAYGLTIEMDDYRKEGIDDIIKNVLPYGAQ